MLNSTLQYKYDRMITGVQTTEVFPYTGILNGMLKGTGTATQMSNISCSIVRFKALNANASGFYIGGSGVSIPIVSNNTTAGYEMRSNDDTGWIPVNNLNTFWYISDSTGDGLGYMAVYRP